MGNSCCNDRQIHQQNDSLINNKTPNKQMIDSQVKRISYIDSQGNPLPNAYKRYVKPPTTVGRQSIIVRNLKDNDSIPQWIWATENNNLLGSGNNQIVHNKPYNYMDNRKTYQEIHGRFQGMPTVNLSKLQYKQKNMTNSEKVQPHYGSSINTTGITYSTAQPNIQSNLSQFNNSNNNFIPTNQPPQTLKKTSSINDMPAVLTSINVNNQPNLPLLKKTDSNTVQVSPFQMITQNQSYQQPAQKPNYTIQKSTFSSNSASVNNSIQQPQYKQVSVGRF